MINTLENDTFSRLIEQERKKRESKNSLGSIKLDRINNLINNQTKFESGSNKNLSKINFSDVDSFVVTDNSMIETANITSSLSKYIDFPESIINEIDSINFNIFKLEEHVGEENTLMTIISCLFLRNGLYSIINYVKLEHFVYEITRGYNRKVVYHNDLHAADVVQTSNLLLYNGELKQKLGIDDYEFSGILLASMMHDFKHPGYNNGFLMNTEHELALQYNDLSVLENYHVAESFKLMKSSPDNNIFEGFNLTEYKEMRKRIIECILATDMVSHFKYQAFLQEIIDKLKSTENQDISEYLKTVEDSKLKQFKQSFLNCIIHGADISNPTKPFNIYAVWADKVMNEFWKQGDKEKALNLPVSMLCDRNVHHIPKSQIGFIGFISPYFGAFVNFCPSLKFLADNLERNKNIYIEEDKKQHQK